MSTKSGNDGVHVAVTPTSVSAGVSDNAINKASGALSLLFPEAQARARIKLALGQRVADRIAVGDYNFSGEERGFIALLFSKEARRLENQGAILQKAAGLLKDPPQTGTDSDSDSGRPHKTSDDWVNRFLAYAEEVSDEHVQELYARIAAGEARCAGAFSMNTLVVLQRLDEPTLEQFRKVRNLVLSDSLLIPSDRMETFYRANGLDYETFLHLSSVGLVNLGPLFVDLRDSSSPECHGFLTYGSSTIRVTGSDDDDLRKQFWSLTSAGIQLARLEPLMAVDAYLTHVCRALAAHTSAPVMSIAGTVSEVAWSNDKTNWTVVPRR